MFKSSENLRLAAEMRALQRVAAPWREARTSWWDGTPESIEARIAATDRVLAFARGGSTEAHMALEREASTARAELKEASHRLMVDFLDDDARAFKGSKRVATTLQDSLQGLKSEMEDEGPEYGVPEYRFKQSVPDADCKHCGQPIETRHLRDYDTGAITDSYFQHVNNDGQNLANPDGKWVDEDHEPEPTDEYYGPEPEKCQHGMSAWLCAGPEHYPRDDDYRWASVREGRAPEENENWEEGASYAEYKGGKCTRCKSDNIDSAGGHGSGEYDCYDCGATFHPKVRKLKSSRQAAYEDEACEGCNAEAGEDCRPWCTGKAKHDDEKADRKKKARTASFPDFPDELMF